MRPSFSTARTNASLELSADHRGVLSRVPPVSRRAGSLPSLFAIQIVESYWSVFSSTDTRTNATCVPSGEICGSATQTNLKRSFSVIGRRSAARGRVAVQAMTTSASAVRLRRWGFIGTLLR